MADKRLSPGEVARRLNLTPGRVRQLSQAHNIGEMVGSMRVYTEADIAALQRARKPAGRPKTDRRA